MEIAHHLQRDILDRLMRTPMRRFSELKPADIESNSFMYHLKQLMQAGYVEKIDGFYRLSANGLTYVDTISHLNLKPRKQPKLVTIIALRNSSGQWLMARRKRQPFINSYMLPSGKQHFGESAETHIDREIKEQFGFDVVTKRRGLTDIRIHRDNVLITHVVGHVYEGMADVDAPLGNDKFDYEWVDADDVMLMAGTKELCDKIANEPSLFFLSLDLNDN